MAKKKNIPTASSDVRTLYKPIAWAILAGLWLLVAAALASYDPADPPGHFVAPANIKPNNLVGQLGANIAYNTYLMLGPGVWVAVTGVLTFLIVTFVGKPVTSLVRRLLGLLVMTVAASAILGLSAPNMIDRPEGAGGLVALYLNNGLMPMLNVMGTMLVMTLLFLIGSIMAADQAVLTLSHYFGRLCMNVANVRVPRPVLVGALSGLKNIPGAIGRLRLPRDTSSVKDDDESEVNPFVASPKRRGRKQAQDETEEEEETKIPTDVGGLGGTESFDLEKKNKGKSKRVEPEEEEVEEVEEETEVQADATTDASSSSPNATEPDPSKPFTPEELRAKIKKLPINFAPQAKKNVSAPLREVDLSGYQFPSMEPLIEPESNFTDEQEKIVREQALALEQALQQYRIEGEVVGIDSGPVITLFEVRLAPGTKVASLNGISSDLARALKSHNIRIVPNTAGKDTIGIEVPNIYKERVRLKELMTVDVESTKNMKLPMFLGKDASGNPLIADLAAMPHMLIAGTTGSGKSVCMNSIIMSFLFTKRPDELKLVLVDPKMVEMSMFKDIPHLMCPVVTEMGKAAAILEWAVTKMDERYELLAEAGVRDISGYNALSKEELFERFQPSSEVEEAKIPKKLPYMVFVIDELADLMMTNKEVESFIVRIAQKARAVGIHLILATQRPQANVVTGLIKGNMPCRVTFKVASGLDSRIVLDQKGGELLLGHGDMLFLSPRSSKLIRAQGTLVDDIEIRKVVKFLKEIAQQNFEPQLMQLKQPGEIAGESTERDPLFDDAVRVVLETQRGSVSLLQRRLTIGYSRASRLIEEMAIAGILGDYKGSQARECNITLEEWDALKAQAEADAAVQVNGNIDAIDDEESESSFDDDADIDEEVEEDEDEEEEDDK